MMKRPECKEIIQVVLPAVRASVAEELHARYNYNQEEIAKMLGVVQVSVSKYLHGKYSKEISHMKNYIKHNRLDEEVIRKLAGGRERREVDDAIDRLCDSLVSVKTAG
jgi:predicted transcriptional regulator